MPERSANLPVQIVGDVGQRGESVPVCLLLGQRIGADCRFRSLRELDIFRNFLNICRVVLSHEEEGLRVCDDNRANGRLLELCVLLDDRQHDAGKFPKLGVRLGDDLLASWNVQESAHFLEYDALFRPAGKRDDMLTGEVRDQEARSRLELLGRLWNIPKLEVGNTPRHIDVRRAIKEAPIRAAAGGPFRHGTRDEADLLLVVVPHFSEHEHFDEGCMLWKFLWFKHGKHMIDNRAVAMLRLRPPDDFPLVELAHPFVDLRGVLLHKVAEIAVALHERRAVCHLFMPPLLDGVGAQNDLVLPVGVFF